MTNKITIDPITRLEGHGKIEIYLDEKGDVKNAFFRVPELRGFERFCEGRPAEELPRITQRICGVCPMAHHMAATKTLDDLWSVEPTSTARKIRELLYSAFFVEDHLLHFFYLGGPDFIVGPDAPAAERNILGVIGKVGVEIAKRLIAMRREIREIMTIMGGKVIHPVFGLPGGVSRGMSAEERERFLGIAGDAVEFAEFSIKAFNDIVLSNDDYVKVITGDAYVHSTHYMGLVDDNNRVNFYDGMIRVVDPSGEELEKFAVRDYLDHIAEHVEPWTYIKFPYLKSKGWKGLVDGPESGVYRVAPLARLNAADGMATPLAQKEFERMYDTLGGKPVHHTLAFHWARLIETLYAAERMVELLDDPSITSDDIRALPVGTPQRGVGVVEAPRGTLIHDYTTDEEGVITGANLIVATLNNSAAICMSVEKAARSLIRGGEVSDGLLNMVEMAFRAYDPCLSCATHSLMGEMPMEVRIIDSDGDIREIIGRGCPAEPFEGINLGKGGR